MEEDRRQMAEDRLQRTRLRCTASVFATRASTRHVAAVRRWRRTKIKNGNLLFVIGYWFEWNGSNLEFPVRPYLLRSNHVCAGFEYRYSGYFGKNRYRIDRIQQIFIIQYSLFISSFAGSGLTGFYLLDL